MVVNEGGGLMMLGCAAMNKDKAIVTGAFGNELCCDAAPAQYSTLPR